MPAPHPIPVFRLSIRAVAGIPPSRRNAALWQACQEDWSRLSLQTSATARLHASTITNTFSVRIPSWKRTRTVSFQSTCACEPGGISTRRYGRRGGAGYRFRMNRRTDW